MRVDFIEYFFNKLEIYNVKEKINTETFAVEYKEALSLFFYPNKSIDDELYVSTNKKLSNYLTYDDIDILFEYYRQKIIICVSPFVENLELIYVTDNDEKLYFASLYIPLPCLTILKNKAYIDKILYNPNTVSLYGVSEDTLIFQTITDINNILKTSKECDVKNAHCTILHINHTNYDISKLKQLGYIKCLGNEYLIVYNTDNIIILNNSRASIFSSEHYALILQNIINNREHGIWDAINKNMKERLDGYLERDV